MQLRYAPRGLLDNRYEINHSQRKQKSLKEITRRDRYFVWKALQPDIHSSDRGYGSHGSQDDREREGAGSLVLGKKRSRRKKKQHMQRKKLLFHRTLFQFSLFGV